MPPSRASCPDLLCCSHTGLLSVPHPCRTDWHPPPWKAPTRRRLASVLSPNLPPQNSTEQTLWPPSCHGSQQSGSLLYLRVACLSPLLVGTSSRKGHMWAKELAGKQEKEGQCIPSKGTLYLFTCSRMHSSMEAHMLFALRQETSSTFFSLNLGPSGLASAYTIHKPWQDCWMKCAVWKVPTDSVMCVNSQPLIHLTTPWPRDWDTGS